MSSIADKILKARQDYYNGTPSLTDEEYDLLVDQLSKIDPNNPAITNVGAPVNSAWEKTTHVVPMGSLNKASTIDEFKDWAKCGKLFFSTLKLDGMSLNLSYKDGKLYQAATRGDGVVGENITPNAKKIPSIPKSISFKDEIHIRGELILTHTNHKKFFEDYSNPRNAASGVSRRLDGSGSEHLSFIAYAIEGKDFNKESELIEFLKELGFQTPEYYVLNLKEVLELHKLFEDSKRAELDFDIDGLVIRLEDRAAQLALGEKNNRPAGAIAFKFKAAEAQTIIKDIAWKTGASGNVTPIALFDEVMLMGAKITKASLYNFSYVEKLGLHVGATVIVKRANDVIPRVESCLTKGIAQKPTHCPECNTLLQENGEYLVCTNISSCPAQKIGRLTRWISENGIMEWGDKILEKLIESGLVNDVYDLYKLSKSDLMSLPRMGEKSADNLLSELDKCKEITLYNFIGSLGINMIGSTIIKNIMSSGISSLDALQSASLTKLKSIHGLGDSKAEALYYGLKSNADRIKKILEAGVSIKVQATGNLSNKTFCFTGTSNLPRKQLHKLVEDHGGTVKTSVGKGLDYLVASETGTSKAVAAKKHGTNIITEEEFLKML
jgi:DNA ligase (NAD+)